jgi:excisionase family DNA binding protein
VNGPANEVLTLSEAADYLRLPEGDVVRLVNSQGLPGRFTGREWRFLKTAIQQWLSMPAATAETRKAAQFALAGKYRDDPDLLRLCEETGPRLTAPAAPPPRGAPPAA